MGKVALTKVTQAPVFRKIALGSWNTVGDPTVYGMLEIDMTSSLRFIEEMNRIHNVKITPVHMVGKALASVMKMRPEINGMIRLGRLYQRKNIDMFYQVNVPGEGPDGVKKASLAGVVVRNADQLSVVEIAQQLKDKSHKIRIGQDKEAGKGIETMRKVPWRLIKFVLNMTSFLTYDLNLNLSKFGIPSDPFGSAMITNVGSLGVDIAWAPLVPYSRSPLLLTVGCVKECPWVVNGKVEVRPIMKIGVTFDHRFMDGVHAAAMSRHFQEFFENPWKVI